MPELQKLPDEFIYEPWEAPPSVLQKAGIILGDTYPEPIVDHAVISKANMGRMKRAYDAHKEQQAAAAASAAKRAKTKR